MRAATVLSLCTIACAPGAAPERIQLPDGGAPAADEGSAPAAPTGGRRVSGKALDASVGGPLRRPNLQAVRMTESPLATGSDEVGGLLAICDESFGSPLGPMWYAFGDAPCYRGMSTAFLMMLHNGDDGLGCSLRFMGSLKNDIPAPFAGIGNEISRADLASFKKIRLQIRGDGRNYRAQFPLKSQIEAGLAKQGARGADVPAGQDCGGDMYDYYGQDFVCGDGSDVWRNLEIDLASLKQIGFGAAVPLDLSQVDRFQIVHNGDSAYEFQCELRVLGLE